MSTSCPRCGTAVATGQARCDACGLTIGGIGLPSRPVAKRALMTGLATQAMDLSDTFNLMFEEQFVGSKLTLARPGMSTAGGKQAAQHIVLHTTGGGALVAGRVDTSLLRAEIRSWAHLRTVHQNRFGTDLPVSAAEWKAFVDRAEPFLGDEGIAVQRDVDPGAGGSGEQGSVTVIESGRRGVPIWLAVLFALCLAAVAVGVTLWLVRRSAEPPAWAPPAAMPVPPATWPALPPSVPPPAPAP